MVAIEGYYVLQTAVVVVNLDENKTETGGLATDAKI